MDIQFVFKKANPLPNEKKSFGKGKNSGKINRKGKNKMKKKAKKKFKPISAYPKKYQHLIKASRKRAKAARAKSKGKGKPKSKGKKVTYKSPKSVTIQNPRRKRNPYYTYSKGSDKKRGVATLSAKFRKAAKKKTAKYKSQVAKITKAIVKAPMANKQYLKSKLDKVRSDMHKKVQKAESALKQEKALRRAQSAERKAMLAAGYSAKFNNSDKGASKMAKPKKAKKSKAKKSKAKKSKAKKSKAKKSKSKKSKAKKSKAKRSKVSKTDRKAIALGRRAMRAKKGRTISHGKKRFKRTNPFFKGASMKDAVKQYLGLDNKEAISLVVGGALHQTVNSLALKVPYADKLFGLPIIGPTILPMIAGIFGKKSGVKALDIISDGLIAASLVAIGIHASSMIPGLKSMNGLMVGPELNFGSFRYFPKSGMSGDSQQMGQDGQQMGREEQGNFHSEADMGGQWHSESMT